MDFLLFLLSWCKNLGLEFSRNRSRVTRRGLKEFPVASVSPEFLETPGWIVWRSNPRNIFEKWPILFFFDNFYLAQGITLCTLKVIRKIVAILYRKISQKKVLIVAELLPSGDCRTFLFHVFSIYFQKKHPRIDRWCLRVTKLQMVVTSCFCWVTGFVKRVVVDASIFLSHNWIDSKAKIKFRGTSFMIGSPYWLTCFFRKNGFVVFLILMALGLGCDGLKCRANMPNRAMHYIIYIYMICWYAQLVVWRRWLVFLWLRFWDAVLWRRLWTCSTYHFMGSRRALAVSVQAEAVFLLIIKFPRHILSRAFIAGWRFPQMVVIVPDSSPSSQKMLSRSTSLQQKHCVDCCPWKGALLRGKQSSNHHFSEASR